MCGRVGSGHLCGCNENLDCISRYGDDFCEPRYFWSAHTRNTFNRYWVSFIFRWFKPGKCSFSTNPWCQMQLYSLLEAFIGVMNNLVTFQGEDHVLLWVFSAVVCSVTSSSTMKYISLSYFYSESIRVDRRRQHVLECFWKTQLVSQMLSLTYLPDRARWSSSNQSGPCHCHWHGSNYWIKLYDPSWCTFIFYKCAMRLRHLSWYLASNIVYNIHQTQFSISLNPYLYQFNTAYQ